VTEHPDDDPRRGLELILSEARRAARVVRNLLMFSHKRETTRALVDINRIVRDTIALRSPDHQAAKVDVIADLAPTLPEVLGDSDQLQQILLNLCINAEQSMVAAHGRGVLTVRTAYDAGRQSVLLTVTDDGPGISAQTRAHVFEPFFTTKSPGSGTGLGLAVARSIAREHGGDIRLEPASLDAARDAPSTVERAHSTGAAFTLILPIASHHGRTDDRGRPR
jgi:signal transduction histidine kinase